MSDKKIEVDVWFTAKNTWRGTVEMTREEFDDHTRKLDTLRGFKLSDYVADLVGECGLDWRDGDLDDFECEDFSTKDVEEEDDE